MTSNPTKFLFVIIGAFVVASTAYAVWSFTHTKDIERQQTNISSAITETQKLLERADARLRDIEALNKQLKEASDQAKVKQDKTESLFAEAGKKVDGLQSKIDTLSATVGDTGRKAELSLKGSSLALSGVTFLIDARRGSSPQNHSPVAFSSVSPGAAIHGPTFDGAGGRDTVVISSDETIFIDGAHLISIEKFKLANGEANAIFVLAPGLNKLDEDWLEIEADPKLDTVTLDGCLSWTKKKSTNKSKTTWVATDTQKKTREVVINSGVNTTVNKTCDNSYAFAVTRREFPETWYAQARAFEAEVSTGSKASTPPQRKVSNEILSNSKAGLNQKNEVKPYLPDNGSNVIGDRKVLKEETTKTEKASPERDVQKLLDARSGLLQVPVSHPKVRTRILTWGQNDAGQLGNGLRGLSITPSWAMEVEKILDGFQVKKIDGGIYDACLLRSDNTVWCWGGGDTDSQAAPPGPVHQVKGLPPIHSFEMGSGYSHCGKASNKSIWCWNQQGERAHLYEYPDWDSSPTVTNYSSLRSSFVHLYPGMSDSCAITMKGKLWCWGETYANDGATPEPFHEKSKIFPIEIPLDKPVIEVDVGSWQACAILSDDSAWCWSMRLHPEPQRLFDQSTRVRQVFSGSNAGCALKEEGTVWCGKSLREGWERNRNLVMKQVTLDNGKPLEGIVRLDSQGTSLFCALHKDTSLWCWGGRGGDPEQDDSSKIIRIKGPDGICGITGVVDVTAGAWSGYAIVRKTDKEFRRLENPNRSADVMSAIQAGDFEKAHKLIQESSCLDVDSKHAELALEIAIQRQQVDLVKALVDAGINLEMAHYKNTSALLVATSPFTDVNFDIIRMLAEAGANPDVRGFGDITPISNLLSNPEKHRDSIALLESKIEQLKGRKLYIHPPASLRLETLKGSEEGCHEGKVVFSAGGTYEPKIPAGCSSILAKVWGAGGAASYGSTGGFSVGVIDIHSGIKLQAIVGGRGMVGVRGENGKGGYNGGGDGGVGSVAPDHAYASGGGGGGRSELIMDGQPLIIAGGGGGAVGPGRTHSTYGTRGLPGGGENADMFIEDYFNFIFAMKHAQSRDGRPGGNGVGGQGGKNDGGYDSCIKATAGAAKEGGTGSISPGGNKCVATGGGGGGAGYGSGGGGAPDGGSGGGGGGLAPEAGITLWGGLMKPANSEDPDYVSPNAQAGEDGLIVLSWPAPEPEKLKEILAEFRPAPQKPETKMNSMAPQ